MVSYAPKSGSVGQHFDFYDVFLLQGYGHRRWQLGQMCDAETEFVAGQPLKLLPEMQVNFDEVLAPGDLLYVPPGLAHYGVAEDDCLTFSFGFRMPNISEMMDRVSDKFSADEMLRTPLHDIVREQSTQIGEMTAAELDYLKAELWARLQNSSVLDDAILSLMSEPKYPENIPEVDEMGVGDLEEALDQGYQIMLEPASRLLYTAQDGQILFWANGEAIFVADTSINTLQKIANGERVLLDENLYDPDILEDLVQLLNDSVLMLLPAEEA
jgi:50S ribosomal protein L16 3-hydroxylase